MIITLTCHNISKRFAAGCYFERASTNLVDFIDKQIIILVCSWLRRAGNASQGVSIYFIFIVILYDLSESYVSQGWDGSTEGATVCHPFWFRFHDRGRGWNSNLLCWKIIQICFQAFVSCTLNGEALGIQRASVETTSSDQVNVQWW